MADVSRLYTRGITNCDNLSLHLSLPHPPLSSIHCLSASVPCEHPENGHGRRVRGALLLSPWSPPLHGTVHTKFTLSSLTRIQHKTAPGSFPLFPQTRPLSRSRFFIFQCRCDSRMLQSRKNEVQSVRASTIRKLSAKETASRCCNSSGITSIALAPPPIVTSRRCLSPSSNGKPSPEKRSSSAERKRPMTPSSPWRLSPRSCTPVDEGMKDFRFADRRLCNARKPDAPWPAMRNLSDSFRFECSSEAKKSVHDFRLAVKITENGPENFKPVENSHHRTKKNEFNSFAKQGREITATQRPSSAHSRLAQRPASPRKAPVSVSSNVRPSSARPAKNNYAMATISSSAMSRNLDVSKRRKDSTRMVTDFKLRMLHNRFLQWLFLNSRANASMVIQTNKSAVCALNRTCSVIS